MLIATKIVKVKQDPDKTAPNILVVALKGGESRIQAMRKIAFNFPAATGNHFLQELRELETLLQAVGKALENIGKEEE